jgi:hypothetical protein
MLRMVLATFLSLQAMAPALDLHAYAQAATLAQTAPHVSITSH